MTDSVGNYSGVRDQKREEAPTPKGRRALTRIIQLAAIVAVVSLFIDNGVYIWDVAVVVLVVALAARGVMRWRSGRRTRRAQ